MIGKYFKGNNFWEVLPEFRAIDVFDSFYREDKSKNHEKSSNIMWAIAFCLRKESPMYNLPNRWELAAKDIAGNEKLNWDDYESIIMSFKESYMTQAERSLLAWEELMAKRDKYLKQQEYYFDKYMTDEGGDNVKSRTGQFITVKGTAEQLDKAFSTTPRMYSDFYKIKKEIEDDEIKRGKGNKVISLNDANEI
jgi:putative NIF3 family GTP cyclohydrolase 1 type 2